MKYRHITYTFLSCSLYLTKVKKKKHHHHHHHNGNNNNNNIPITKPSIYGSTTSFSPQTHTYTVYIYVTGNIRERERERILYKLCRRHYSRKYYDKGNNIALLLPPPPPRHDTNTVRKSIRVKSGRKRIEDRLLRKHDTTDEIKEDVDR